MPTPKQLNQRRTIEARRNRICRDFEAGMRAYILARKYNISTTTIYKDIVAWQRSTYWGKARDVSGVYKWNGRKWMPACKWELRDWLGAE
jgi:uncharacterized protein YjcR